MSSSNVSHVVVSVPDPCMRERGSGTEATYTCGGMESLSEHLMFLLVHRIGRTGRCGKTGIATTFINKLCGTSSTTQVKFTLFTLPTETI